MTGISSVIHWILAFSLFGQYENKMTPIVIATTVHFVFRFIVPFTFAKTNAKCNENMISIRDSESWKDLKEIFQQGFDSLMLRVMAWWAFDVFTQLAATQDVSTLGGQTILRNIGLFTYMIPVGLSVSANILTGKYIGKGKVNLAQKISRQIIFMTFLWSLVQMIAIWVGKDAIINFYTSNADVKKAILPAWSVLIFFVFFDCMQGVSSGLISGLGVVGQVKWVSTIGYWVIGIPVSCFLMFYKDMKLEGLWWGPSIACLLNYTCYEIKVQSLNWQDVADAHAAQMKKKKEQQEARKLV